MGGGMVVIFLLLMIAIPSLIYAMINYKHGFGSRFWKSFIIILLSIMIYFCLNFIYGYFGKKSGGFADSWYIEVKNNYFLEFIDSLENASLMHKSEDVFTSSKQFGETFKLALNKDKIIVLLSTNPNKPWVIDTMDGTIKQKKISSDNLVFLTPKEYYLQETQTTKNILLKIFLGILSLLISIGLLKIFEKERDHRNKTK